MRGFIVLCLCAVAMAAPQGYTYNTSPSVGGGSGSLTQAGLSSTFGTSYSIAGGFHTGGHNIGGDGPHGFLNQAVAIPQPPQAIISKRFFIHTAPEDADELHQEKHITVGVPRKNYNVVFIKSPSRPHKKTSIKITPAVNEEKTIIYVLNKKADAIPVDAQVLEQNAVTTKPEVFFIKYKTPEEAAHAQQEIQAQYDALGGSSQVTDEGVAPVSSVIGLLNGANAAAGGAGESTIVGGGGSAAVQQTAGHIAHGNNDAYLPPNFN